MSNGIKLKVKTSFIEINLSNNNNKNNNFIQIFTFVSFKAKLFISGLENNFPASIYFFKVNNLDTRKKCEICSKLKIKRAERRHWRHSGVFIVNFEHISPLFLVFLLLTLNRQILLGYHKKKFAMSTMSNIDDGILCENYSRLLTKKLPLLFDRIL